MHSVHPTPEQFGELRHLRFRHPCPAVQRRAEVILLAACRLQHNVITEALDLHPNTVTRFIVMFNDGGMERLKQWRKGDTDTELGDFDRQTREYWDKHPPRSAQEAASHLESVTGIRRGLTAVRGYLRRLGFKYRKAGGVPGKADPEKQEWFVREVIDPRMAEAREGKRRVYFVDAAHFVYGSFLGFLWCLARQFIRTPAGRQRYNVLGAVDVLGGHLLTVTNTAYINALSVCELLAKMAAEQAGRPVTVFLDNARYQHCALVMDKARELGIELMFLPPYSPNLNLIERLWKHMRKTSLTNREFGGFAEFQQAIDTGLSEAFTLHTAEMRKLLNPKFQLFKKSLFQAA
jgi:transposase